MQTTVWTSNLLLGLQGGSVVKNPPATARDEGSIPEFGRSPGGGHGNPLQYSCLKNAHGQKRLGGNSPQSLKFLSVASKQVQFHYAQPKHFLRFKKTVTFIK